MKSVMEHKFSDLPAINVPRSKFNRSHGLKTTFNAGDIIPIFYDEVYPADSVNLDLSSFARLATPVKPIMDNLFIDYHFFEVPLYQVWNNFRKFQGEQDNPGDSVDFLVPTVDINGAGEGSLADYFALPIKTTTALNVSALYFRAYQHIWNTWYRDENIQDSVTVDKDDGPDTLADYAIRKRGKRKDYFTSCLPWPQKGDAINLPLGTTAPVVSTDTDINFYNANDATVRTVRTDTAGNVSLATNPSSLGSARFGTDTGLEADLTNATAASINDIREAFQLQKVLEKDARNGSRYCEMVKGHFGVEFYDHPVRPRYLGGGTINVNINPVAQQSETGTTPQGTMSAFGTASGDGIGFTASFNQHSIVMGMASLRADLTYQQGVPRQFSRSIREDYYLPSLAHLGEQEVLNQEIYFDSATPSNNTAVFGYQERYAELRYAPSRITGGFRSNYTASFDVWHLSQEFGSLPSLNDSFIQENPPMTRIKATSTDPDVIMDCYFTSIWARPMPMYSVPGFVDHF